jgi:hypothetical protein
MSDSGAADPAAGPSVVKVQGTKPGWWRRNRWGLLALVPAIALGLAVPVHDNWAVLWDHAPRTQVGPSTDGWVGFAGAEIRLVTLAPATDLTDASGRPARFPAGVTVWQASITFRTADASRLLGCDLRMVDQAGATYQFNPAELQDADVDVPYADCSPSGDAATPPPSWTETVYFAAPSDVRPVCVRLTLEPDLPKYALLTT